MEMSEKALGTSLLASAERVLVLVAHPDDEALMCGGTIRLLADAGRDVQVVSVTDGAQGRTSAFSRSCQILGANGEVLEFPAGRVVEDLELVAAIDGALAQLEPNLVITHGSSVPQHQDHGALRRSVERSLSRYRRPVLAIGGEEASGSAGWRPRIFIDISSSLDAKVEAVLEYNQDLPRPYLSRQAIVARSAYWSLESSKGAHAEAFDLITWK